MLEIAATSRIPRNAKRTTPIIIIDKTTPPAVIFISLLSECKLI
jgi:hypothetical protein